MWLELRPGISKWAMPCYGCLQTLVGPYERAESANGDLGMCSPEEQRIGSRRARKKKKKTKKKKGKRKTGRKKRGEGRWTAKRETKEEKDEGEKTEMKK